ncbi:uncharacterized protein LOC103705697 [Phoenix dactylifera]|uniref:Uncharacterized protein LOC103705697 n=1 Tax=Phoenix dactylifera TaxID=42345 RepID=A0A8B7BY07_PHODC|nr:uncharacterized protein LOC103705697 [Phoenix dactylifera]
MVIHTMRTNLLFCLSISCLLSSAAAMSAYEVLKSHGLPMGLLPKGVRDFQVDGDGRFEVRLDAACTAKFESQSEVRFNSTVAGTLSYGQIAALSGVAAQELFLWFPVRGIRVDIPSSGLIYFDVGVIYKRFSLSLFETPLDCIPFSSSSSSEARLPSKNRSGKLRYTLDQQDAQRPVL